MSHRRPDPRQAGLEQTLRRALRLAGDSVEPAADGLDRIRAKISAGSPARAHWASWASGPGLADWRTRYMTGLLAALAVAARYLEPAWIRVRYACGAVAERFKPDRRADGWLGWLRPAAALATGLLVVTGASWAIAGLPQVITSSGNSGPATTAGSGNNSSSSGQRRRHPIR